MSVFIPFKNHRPVFIGVYSITSPSGKVYVGQSWSIITRWRQYEYQSGIHNQRKLSHSLKKYGPKAHTFKILAWFSAGCSQADLDQCEQYWMDQYRSAGVELLNLREGGSRGKQSLESIRKAVETRHARGSYVVTEEARARTSAQFKGKKQDPSVVARRAAKQKGQRRPTVALRNVTRTRSDEEKKKQSEARKKWWVENRDRPRRKLRAYKRSKESCQKISELKKEWWAKKRVAKKEAQWPLF